MQRRPPELTCYIARVMIERLKRSWERLRDDPPGERFQRRYERHHEDGISPLRRWSTIGLGVAVLAAGIFFLPAPGPGMVIVALGAGLIAQQSRHAARVLDWIELRVRGMLDWGLGVYRRASTGGRLLLVALGLILIGGAMFLGFRVLFPG